MSRQLKPYICRLRETLEAHNLYHERNDTLIKDVAMTELIRDTYLDTMKEQGPLLRQVGSQGQTKININPIYVEIRKLLATIINGKAKLGLGNLGRTMEEQTQNEFENFINEINQ